PQYVRPKLTPEKTKFPSVDFALESGSLVKGFAFNDNNEPIADARVRALNNHNGDWNYFGALGQAFTDEHGYFEVWISKKLLGSFPWIRIDKVDYGCGFFLDFSYDELNTFKVPRGGKIIGNVVDNHGERIPNCEVSVRDFRGQIDATKTDENGRYVLEGVPGKPSVIDFRREWSNRVGRSAATDADAHVKVYAKPDSEMGLDKVPHYQITLVEGETITAPALVVERYTTIAGKLVGGETVSPAGLTVVLDGDWEDSVFTDASGGFYFSSVAAGKHHITAYLSHNLQGGRGIGYAEVQVEAGKPLQDIHIYLQEMAEVRVQFLDSDGNPLEGVLAKATWTKNVDGPHIDGTRSDNQGWAVIYLYPDEAQYIHGRDSSNNLVTESIEEITPQQADLVNDVRILMIPIGSIKGRLLNEDHQPLEDTVNYLIDFADGTREYGDLKADRNGFFEIKKIKPGIATFQLRHPFLASTNLSEQPLEIKSTESKDIGNIVVSFHTAAVKGRLLRGDGQPFTDRVVLFKINYSDGTEKYRRTKPNSGGYFRIERCRPGIANLTIRAESMLYTNILERFEIKENETNDLGVVSLIGGIDEEEVLRDKHAHALENPEEIIEAAQRLFEGIRDADYDRILKHYVNGRWKKDGWKDFPPHGYYMVNRGWPSFALWCCRTFKENPIIEIELGEVFPNQRVILRKKNLPTVPYRLTLEDGTVLNGNLPFEFNFDGLVPHWHGLEGIDWHLQ
ncbi:MAG: carboxypeptidase-like regulatory domain-containing protein, partial [Planctomycetota bacterium]